MFNRVITVVSLLLFSVTAHAVVINFESSTPGVSSAPISEVGFTVSSSAIQNAVGDTGISGWFTNGTNVFGWCVNDCGGVQTITVTEDLNAPFTLNSIDAANLDPGYLLPGQTIDIVGNISGGGTVNASFALVLDAYTTFNLTGFTNLTSVEITSNPVTCPDCDITIDNIVLNEVAPATPVPTMSVWGLGILAGLLGLMGFVRRRKA